MWGRGLRGNKMALAPLSACFQSLPLLPTIKLGPSGADFPGGWVCVLSRTSWVSPGNSPVRLGLSPTTSTPTGFYRQSFWGFIFPHQNPGLCGLSCSPVVPPSLFACKYGATQSSCCLPTYPVTTLSHVSLPQLPVSSLPTSLNECFFFNSLVVGLPYSSIFCQFWLFLNLLLSFFVVAWGSKVYIPTPPTWPEVHMFKY